MLLSVVIVNYNVRSFLEQCLNSIRQSRELIWGSDFEVFVVDNRSADGSVEMVRERFPEVHLIANQENLGFAKANNQAIRRSSAKYVLLLNPDTLVENDTLKKCIDFMESRPDAGGLGVKMMDGQGRYLKESKRGLATPATSFYKISGLCKIFPRSERFAAYYMGHLDENETNPVQILSGAFMLLRRQALDKVGLLDESFFMYGEDIDLSYRILLGGYRNYYFPQTRIIHYKGESTKKGSLNYVLVFYKAMEIFAEKYFSKGRYRYYIYLLRLAIWFRAGLSILSRMLRKVLLPFTDAVLFYTLLVALSFIWPKFAKGNAFFYPDIYRLLILPVYTGFLVGANALFKAYRVPVSLKRCVWGIAGGMAGFLLLGALLGAHWQFSRFMVVAGALLCLCLAVTARWVFSRVFKKSFPLATRGNRHYLVVGKEDECRRVQQLLQNENVLPAHIHFLRPEHALSLILEQIRINKIGEVIFCARDLNFDQILLLVSLLQKTGAESKIISPGADVRVGYKFKLN
ncbi:MAG: glycosyltransferase [Bacteroides sp.]|nr:glycosyltransferase [Bacteroides sp.]MCM1085045.1 glycosyltransferase [Bacteroides sp.]